MDVVLFRNKSVMEGVCTSKFTVLPYFVHKPLFTSNTHPKQFQHMQKRDPHRGNTQPTQPPHSSNTVPKQPPHSFHTASTQLPHSPRTSPTQANPAKPGEIWQSPGELKMSKHTVFYDVCRMSTHSRRAKPGEIRRKYCVCGYVCGPVCGCVWVHVWVCVGTCVGTCGLCVFHVCFMCEFSLFYTVYYFMYISGNGKTKKNKKHTEQNRKHT